MDLGATAEHGATVRALAFDPTGAWLLSGDDTKTMRLWRTSDWTVAHTLCVTWGCCRMEAATRSSALYCMRLNPQPTCCRAEAPGSPPQRMELHRRIRYVMIQKRMH